MNKTIKAYKEAEKEKVDDYNCIEDFVRRFDNEVYSSESKESIECLMKAIKDKNIHIYWYNWETVFKIIQEVRKQTSKQALQEMKEELESLKTKGSWSSVLEEIDKKLKQIDEVLE